MKSASSIVKPASSTTIFEKVYFCFFAILPFIYSDKIVDPVLIPRQMFLSFFVLLIGIMIAYRISIKKLYKDFSFLRSAIPICFGLLLIFVVLSFFQAIVISESLYVLSKFSIEILFFIFTTYLITQKQLQAINLAKAIVLFVIIVMFYAYYQLLNLDSPNEKFEEKMYTVTSTIAHKNLLASILFLSFPFLLIAFTLKKYWKIAIGLLIVLSILLIWIIQSRAAIMAVFVFIALIIFFQFRNRSLSAFLKPKVVLTFSLILVMLVGLFTYQNKEKFGRFFNQDSARERISMWENSVSMISDNFVFGVGAGNWQIHFPEHGLDKFPNYLVKRGQVTFQRPHNDFLWIFSEMGIGGFLVYCTLFILLFYYLIKLLRKRDEHYWLYSSLLAGIVGYIIIALLDFPLERIEHQVFLMLIFAIVTARYHSIFNVQKEKNISSLPGLPVLIGSIIIFSLVVSFNRNQGELGTHRLYEAHHTANWNLMIEEAGESTNAFYQIDATSIPIAWYHGVALFTLGRVDEAQVEFEKAFQLNPFNIHVINNLASCYETKGDHDKAILLYKKALQISSDFEETLLNLSAAYFNKGEYENAYLTIEKVDTISTDPKYRTFLPAILKKKVEQFLKEENRIQSSSEIEALMNSNDELMNFYFESKTKEIEFTEYLQKIFR